LGKFVIMISKNMYRTTQPLWHHISCYICLFFQKLLFGNSVFHTFSLRVA